jgi:quinol-cytochrome oxidoreductase complex cytochrome b subunit
VVLAVTGLYLMFLYTPAVTMAHQDLQRLQTSVGFGQLLRNVHRWGAHLMVLVVGLHLARVFVDGAYRGHRGRNWVWGVGLFVVTLGFSFTGYLLPWDQLSYWAVTVGAALLGYVPLIGGSLREAVLGGPVIGQATLLRFYVLHVGVFTAAFLALLAVHLWRVRKDGFAVADEGPPEPGHPVAPVTPRLRLLGAVTPAAPVVARDPSGEAFTWPHLLVRHVVVSLATLWVLLMMSVAFDAPLRELANPMHTPEPAKAPWYFVGVQELLAHFPPVVGGVLLPAFALAVVTAWPWLEGRLPAGARPWAHRAFLGALVLAVVLTVVGAFFRGPGWRWVWPWVELYFEP